MENDQAIKILRMRASFCSWEDAGERFNQSYASPTAVRESLKLWGKNNKVDIDWAFTPYMQGRDSPWNLQPPDGWLAELQKKLGKT